MLKEKIEIIFNLHYKKFIILPILVLLFSLIVIANKYYTTGDFIEKDISLKGGISATIHTDKQLDIKEAELFLSSKLKSDVSVRKIADFTTGKQIGITVETTNNNVEDLRNALQEKLQIQLTNENYSAEEVGSSLGESFFKELLYAVLFAFIFISIVVFITFRVPIPSLTVLLAAFTDIIATLAVVNLLGIKMSTGGIAAFLMLIGYSIDTDILLTTRVLKRKEGSLFDRMYESAKPGLMMTSTTIVAVLVGYLVSTSIVMQQIFLIILIGGIWDIFNTWITNTCILYWYCKAKGIT